MNQEQSVTSSKSERPLRSIKAPYALDGQVRFIVDLRGRSLSERELVYRLLTAINDKDEGRELSMTDLALFALSKIDDSDIKKIQGMSLSSWERMNKLCQSFNEKQGTSLTLEEFLLQKLKIN